MPEPTSFDVDRRASFVQVFEPSGQREPETLRSHRATASTNSSVANAARAPEFSIRKRSCAQILFAPAQTHRCRQRHGNQTRVLAGEEQDDELGARFGNQCNAVATL